MTEDHLVLAGGGHTHSLVLRRWCMQPHLRPKGLVTLISRKSTTLYSGMVPGLIAGHYKIDELLINLRDLTEEAGVAFVLGEITGLNLINNYISLDNRSSINYQKLSLDVGSETVKGNQYIQSKRKGIVIPIKPFSQAFKWIEAEDKYADMPNQTPITIAGTGFSAVEVALALRTRWALRPLQLQVKLIQFNPKFKQALDKAKIDIVSVEELIPGPTLLCTGSNAPDWLRKSNLAVDSSGRVLTNQSLQVINHSNLFAVGDCGVIKNNFRTNQKFIS